MKTINIVCNYASLYGGNFIPSLLAFARHISPDNKVIFSFPVGAEERTWAKYIESEGFQVFYFNKKIVKDIKRINKANSVNVVYTHFVSTPIAKLFSPFSKKTKLVIHIHSDFRGGNSKLSFTSKLKKLVFEKMIRKDANYIYVSETLKNEDRLKNSFYVRNALCLERIPSSDDFTRFEKISDSNSVTFLMYGWSPFVKGVDIVVKAFANLDDYYKKACKLLIIHDNNKEKDCADYIKEKTGIDVKECENIHLLNPVENVLKLYDFADVFISASRSEGFSYSILEALHSGLDVIMSDIEGTKWAKEYGAVQFKLNDTSDLIEVLKREIDSKHKKVKNEEIEDAFSIEKWVKSIADICLK